MIYQIKMYSLKNMCTWHRLTLALMLITLHGCSTFRPDQWYLHNPVHKELADQAKSNWTHVQANLWQDLLKNQKLTSDAELSAQRVLQQSVVSSRHIEMVNMTWSEMLKKAIINQGSLKMECGGDPTDDGKCVAIEKQKNEFLETSTEVGKQIAALIKETKSKEEAVKKALENQKHWQEELVLFEKATQEFLLQQASKPENSQDFLKNVQKQATDIIGKDGIRKLIPEDGIADKPPGITFEILSLGADLAKAQLEREKAIERRLLDEITLFSNRKEEIIVALNWVNNAITELDSPGFKNEHNNTVFFSIQKSLKNNTTPNTEGLILTLQKYVLADDLYTLTDNTFEISKAVLVHHYAIEDSAISAKEHEALIQRGLETLAVYHTGGITQEEINTILQAAQAIALGVISAGVI